METVLNSENFSSTINSNALVLVDFWATWCGPCKMLAPTIEELAKQYEGKVKVCKVDVDENPQIAEEYLIYSIPTIILFQDGIAKEKLIGFRVKSQIEEVIGKYL